MTWEVSFPMHVGRRTVGLAAVLCVVPENDWDWRLWDFYGIRPSPDGTPMPDFERATQESPNGHRLPWTALVSFAADLDQVFDCLLTASLPGQAPPTPVKVMAGDFGECLVAIRADDSTQWHLSSNFLGDTGAALREAWEALPLAEPE
jgi:hypothetical protein